MGEQEKFTAELTLTPDDKYKTATLRDKHTVQTDEPTWLPEGNGGGGRTSRAS